MNWRPLIIIGALALVSFLSMWVFKRNKPVPLSKQSIDTLIIGTNAEFPPFALIENDQIIGFDIDVIQEAAKRMNKKITLKDMSFDALIPELQIGSIHIIAAGMTPTIERAKRAFFTSPHFDSDPLMAVQTPGSDLVSTKEQLKGKKVVVNQGYSSDNVVGDIEGIDVMRVSSPLISTGLLAINSGQADVYVASRSSLQPFLAKDTPDYMITPIENTGESSSLAVSKQYPQLYSELQSVLSEMMKDGTIEKLKKKWKLND